MVQGNYYYPLMARLKSLYGDVTGCMIVIEQQLVCTAIIIIVFD